MKKIIILLLILAALALPSILPMPLMTSGMVAQYALGDTITLNVTAWNLSPLSRDFPVEDGGATATLKVDGKPVASIAATAPVHVGPFGQATQKLSYKISKKNASAATFDAATGAIELPTGEHKLSMEWLGSSSLGSTVRIVEL